MEPQSNTVSVTSATSKTSGVKAPLSAERLQSLAMARVKATEVRRQKAAQKEEARELQRLEREVERQSLVKRRQELESKLAGGNCPKVETPSTVAPRTVDRDMDTIEEEPAPKIRRSRRPPPPTPVSTSSSGEESEEDPQPITKRPRDCLSSTARDYRAKVKQMQEDIIYRSLFP